MNENARRFAPSKLLPKQKNASVGRKHLVIPDGQVKPGVPLQHWIWIGNYIVDKKPDVIVNIGDFADIPSLCSYDKGKRGYEGRRYIADIKAAHEAMRMLMTPIQEYNRTASVPYNPELHLTLGNHEERILRATELDAMLHGAIKIEDLQYEEWGWKVHDFLEVVEIDGIQYSHYFISGSMGRPVSSAAALLKARGGSATMGHVQRMDVAYHPHTQQIGLMCATCYLHDEPYLGPQGNSAPRQIIVKHEVEGGRYDLMAVSLKFLKKRYS